MPLYQVSSDALVPIPPVTFAAARLSERHDLQRLLRDHIEVIDPDLLVIAEEFADWDDSARRIDLLAVDRDANLVVIELKVTEDGGHADLQAIRYAAMVSALTFDQAVDAFARYRADRGLDGDARELLLGFLRRPDGEPERFGADVRIVLVGPGFSKELTTTVLWLRDRGVDLRCVRFRPHRLADGTLEGTLVADVAQLIPLREAQEFQVRVSRKAQVERAAERGRPSLEEMRRRVEEGRTAAEREGIEAVVRHLEALGGRWFANAASMAVSLRDARGIGYHPLCFRPGEGPILEVWFRWLSGQGVFEDARRREELLDRLNAVPGVALPRDAVTRMPKLPVSILADPGVRARFCDVWTWFADVVRQEADAGAA